VTFVPVTVTTAAKYVVLVPLRQYCRWYYRCPHYQYTGWVHLSL